MSIKFGKECVSSDRGALGSLKLLLGLAQQILLVDLFQLTALIVDSGLEIGACLCDDDDFLAVGGKSALGVQVLVAQVELGEGLLLVITCQLLEQIACWIFLFLVLVQLNNENVDRVAVRRASQVQRVDLVVEDEGVDVRIRGAPPHLLERLDLLGLLCLFRLVQSDDCACL